VLSACSKTPQPSGPPLDTSARAQLAAPAAPLENPRGPTNDAPPYLPDGCWTGMALGGAPESLLATLADRCAPGMRAFEPGPKRVELGGAESSELAVAVDDTASCLRALATGGPGIDELELELVDSRDRVLGKDELEAPFALVGPRGPVCADAPGAHRARVHVTRGRGSVAFGVFRAE